MPPFTVDIFDAGSWQEVAGPFDTIQEAARFASYLVRRDWRTGGREDHVLVLDARGREC